MGKKPTTQKMSLADLNAKFGGNMAEQQLPSQSVGKDFGKAKGKGFRDIDGAQEANEWRSSGPRKGKGKGDSEPSRADTGDWRGGGGGPREDRGGGGGGGFQRREREDNTQAGKDEDWRGSMGRREDNDRDDRRGGGDRFGRGGFGDRDRDRDRGGSRADEGDWRRGGGGGGGGGSEQSQSERPRLNLKPRSKPVDGAAPAGNEANQRIEEEEKSEEKKPALGGGGGGKYVPPAQRKAMEEEEAKRKEMEERRNRQRELDRQQEEEKERRREEMRSKQRAEEERRQREEDAKREKREAEEAKKAEAEKQRKMEMKAAKEAEAKERREALKSASQAQKKASQSSGKKQVFDASKIDGFVESCEEVVKEEGPVEKLVDELDELLSEDEWSTVQPIARLNEMLLQHCRGKQDEEVFSIVQTWAPMLNCLIEKAGIHRFKVKVLIEAQRAASKMGLPRLSPATALLEAFFDGLYRAEVIEEDYFEMWAVGDDDTAGKTSAMFQVTAFLDWLRGKMDEDEEQEGEGEEEEDEDDDEEEEEEDDIEANVPTTRRK